MLEQLIGLRGEPVLFAAVEGCPTALWGPDWEGKSHVLVQLRHQRGEWIDQSCLFDTGARVSVMARARMRRGGWQLRPTALRSLTGVGAEGQGNNVEVLGAVLMQRDDAGKLQACRFFSRKLLPAETRYSATERE